MKNKYNPLLEAGIQKISDHRLVFYDATVGIGGDYLTHALAFAEGKRKVKQISNVTETESPAIVKSYYIEGNGFNLTCNYRFIPNFGHSTLTIKNLTINTTFNIPYSSFIDTKWIVNLNNVVINGASKIKCNELYADKCRFNSYDPINKIWAKGVISNTVFSDSRAVVSDKRYWGTVYNTKFYNCDFHYVHGTSIAGEGGASVIDGAFEGCTSHNGYLHINNSNVKYLTDCSRIALVYTTCGKITASRLIFFQFWIKDVSIFAVNSSIIIRGANQPFPAHRLNVVNTYVRMIWNYGIATFTQFKMVGGWLGSKLQPVGWGDHSFQYDKLDLQNVEIRESIRIIDDYGNINNCRFEGDVTIENTAEETIFKNNRIAGTFIDNGVDTELANNIN